MSKTITLSLPHDLSEAEVKARMVSGIAASRAKHPAILKHAQETWTTDRRMEFRVSAMGQAMSGRLDIRPKTVEIAIDLPHVLALLADYIRPQIESEARKALGAPPTKRDTKD